MDIKELKSIRTMRAALPNATENDLDDIIGVLNKLKDEIKERKEKEIAEQQKVETDMVRLEDFMREQNIHRSALQALANKCENNLKSGRTVEPKYRYSVDGVEYTWTGRGRMPKPFEKMLEITGTQKEQYLIEK